MAVVNEEFQRIRGYLQAQAARLPLPELIAKVRTDSAALQQAGAGLSPESFNRRPAADDWSAAEVWTHVLEMNEHGAAAIVGIIEQGAVPPRQQDRISGDTRSELHNTAGYWQAFSARREPFLTRVAQARGDEHLEVTIEHPMFGALNWREWLLFMRVHDLDHLRQLQSITEALSG